ncbi:13518_t:CDS:2 [Entrophospora sp. SA101]|nr:13518_t:CDS:2 [Entrophospora sp. SA101]
MNDNNNNTIISLCGNNNFQQRHRTTASQSQFLESYFQNVDDFPDSNMRERIALNLNMPSKSVHIWFQNRRAKRKQEERTCQEQESLDNCNNDLNSNITALAVNNSSNKTANGTNDNGNDKSANQSQIFSLLQRQSLEQKLNNSNNQFLISVINLKNKLPPLYQTRCSYQYYHHHNSDPPTQLQPPSILSPSLSMSQPLSTTTFLRTSKIIPSMYMRLETYSVQEQGP